METKLSNLKLFLFVSLLFSFSTGKGEEYSMSDIRIDSVKIGDPRFNYSHYFGCNIKEKKQKITDTDITVNIFMYECDSVEIYFDVDIDGKYPFTNYLEVYSSQKIVYLADNAFKVGMSIEDVGNIFPELQEKYSSFINEREKNIYEPAYFGVPMPIKAERIPYKSFEQGKLSFNIKGGKVVSILIDFRADGDYD